MNHLCNTGNEINRDSLSSGERRGKSPNHVSGVVGPHGDDPGSFRENQIIAERLGKACQRVGKPRKRTDVDFLVRYLSTAGHGKPGRKQGRPRSKAKYFQLPIEEKYREGKAKRTPARGVK